MGFIVPFIPLILGLGGTAISAVGQIKSGNAAEGAAEFNANIALEDAAIKEKQQRYTDQRTLSSGRAIVGASGVQMSGSPLDVMAESARQAELDALIIRRGGQLEAESTRLAGKQQKQASRYSAASTILTGAYGVGKDLIALGRTKK
jgi:hypothetical protein